jgi:hypothetical protein
MSTTVELDKGVRAEIADRLIPKEAALDKFAFIYFGRDSCLLEHIMHIPKNDPDFVQVDACGEDGLGPLLAEIEPRKLPENVTELAAKRR